MITDFFSFLFSICDDEGGGSNGDRDDDDDEEEEEEEEERVEEGKLRCGALLRQYKILKFRKW